MPIESGFKISLTATGTINPSKEDFFEIIDELKESNKTLNDLCASHEARILSDSELIDRLKAKIAYLQGNVGGDEWAFPGTGE